MQNSAKNGLLDLGFYVFKENEKGEFRSNFPRTMEASALGKGPVHIDSLQPEKIAKISTAHFTGESGPMHFVLFDDLKDTCLALRGFSVIRKGHFYDTGSLF